ncbi:hypothetical protein [Kitasatospora purpeofusca]|uniref:hypothetical protein n=1 Tax=Kitasatospora purpeofusca TaxID=67352 RepID=UPI0036468385
MTRTAVPTEAMDHGDPRRYGRGCRCGKCKAGRSRYTKALRHMRHQGETNRRPACRAADHIRALRMAGMNDASIMAAAGISVDAMYKAAVATAVITRATEDAVLAVQVPEAAVGEVVSRAKTDATGTWRRVQALAAAGWPATAVADRLGCTNTNITYLLRQCGSGNVNLRTADQIRRIYLELWNQRPEDHGVSSHIASRTRRYAARQGWHPAAVWDDIDDPNDRPQYGDTSVRDLALIEDAAELAAQGQSREAIAVRLGVTWPYIAKAHSRRGIPVPQIAA